ncbi:hypothetical protein OH738_22595 [Streptomyces hirsutus]|uniref:hypothetical protein n=1 Tax=Streptomyces TaxID=1883 RepID=UPI00387034B5|nr:hypothetical protein OH738_22595 [Streptomyces hirsutus]WTD75793.1 hypothetical protein OHB56_18955 [Streptomyces sp. NBC_01635]
MRAENPISHPANLVIGAGCGGYANWRRKACRLSHETVSREAVLPPAVTDGSAARHALLRTTS